MGNALTWSSFRDYFETFIGTPVLGPVPWDASVFVPESAFGVYFCGTPRLLCRAAPSSLSPLEGEGRLPLLAL